MHNHAHPVCLEGRGREQEDEGRERGREWHPKELAMRGRTDLAGGAIVAGHMLHCYVVHGQPVRTDANV